jgi:hypothetical protein
LPKVRDELGHSEEDPAKRVVLREFLRKYAEERRSPHGAAALRWLQPPLHIWSGAQPFAPYSLAPRDVPLDAISISLSEWALSDGRIVKLNGEDLMTVVVVGAD